MAEKEIQTISQDVLQKLETYEEYLSYYISLDEAATNVSWIKADLLVHMQNKLGDKSILALAKDVRQPYTTVVNYIRVARAFPPERRLPNVSFSHHYQASYADTYNEKERRFLTQTRFMWLARAADEQFSVRRLMDKVQMNKLQKENHSEIIPCIKCNTMEILTRKYLFYSPGARKEGIQVFLCDNCFLKVADYIYGAKPR